MTETRKVGGAMSRACAQCPWRKSNQGKSHPDGWYTKKNLQRLWAGMRTGEAPGMTCHPTDPNNPTPKGWKDVPKEAETKECAGALLLVTRELKLLEKDVDGYRKMKRKGLNKFGLHFWAMVRCHFAGTPVGGPPIPVIDEDPDIYYEPLALKEEMRA
jgi:hypothetical protein